MTSDARRAAEEPGTESMDDCLAKIRDIINADADDDYCERGWYWADRWHQQADKAWRLMTLMLITLFATNLGWLALVAYVTVRAAN